MDPDEQLPVSQYDCSAGGDKWEEAVLCFVEEVFIPLGFKLEALARVPYLCVGNNTDYALPYFKLDDAIFVLSHANNNNEES